MALLAGCGIVAGLVIFYFAPGGANLFTVGSAVLVVASMIVGIVVSDSDESLNPFVEDLGLPPGSYVRSGGGRSNYSGAFKGRAVKVRLSGEQVSKHPITHAWTLSISMSCANPRQTRLRVVPVLPHHDVYLEILPPKLDGQWPWAEGFEVRGEPAEAAKALVGKVRWDAMTVRGYGGDSVKLQGEECSFETKWGAFPSLADVRARLELTADVAAAAD